MEVFSRGWVRIADQNEVCLRELNCLYDETDTIDTKVFNEIRIDIELAIATESTIVIELEIAIEIIT